MKSVLISIQPKWVEKICKGEKTIEVRKTRPKIETPFKCYIYCNKDFKFKVFKYSLHFSKAYDRCAKIIGEFICDKVFLLHPYIYDGGSADLEHRKFIQTFEKSSNHNEILSGTCLSQDEMFDYIGVGNYGYGWHISRLKIYDKPKELSEFYKPIKYDNVCGANVVHCGHYQGLETVDYCEYNDGDCSLKGCKELRNLYQIKIPPQSWQYVEEI